MKNLFIYIIFSVSSAIPMAQLSHASTQLSITLNNPNKTITYKEKQRLSDVLFSMKSLNLDLSFPLSSTIYDESFLSKKSIAKQKKIIIDKLRFQYPVPVDLIALLERNTYSQRLISNLDIDSVRLNKLENPLLTGNLSLVSLPRNNNFLITGNVINSKYTPLEEGKSLEQYLDGKINLEGKKISSPILIYPDGKIIQTNTEYWSHNKYYYPSNTIVFVPFNTKDSSINDEVTKLLSNQKTRL